MQRMQSLALHCLHATSVHLPPGTPFALRAVWPLRRQAESNVSGPRTGIPWAKHHLLVGWPTPWHSGHRTLHRNAVPLHQQRHPALQSLLALRERTSPTGPLSDPLISRDFLGSKCLHTPHHSTPLGTTVLPLSHRRSSFTRIILTSSLSHPSHTLHHKFWFLPMKFFDVFFNHMMPPLVYPFSFPVAKYIRHKFEKKIMCRMH